MTDTAPWDRYRARRPVHIVGEFENEGERFVVYRNGNGAGQATGDKVFITGDEFDWEPAVGLLWADFLFSADERDKIAKILWPLPLEDKLEDLQMIPRLRKLIEDNDLADYMRQREARQ